MSDVFEFRGKRFYRMRHGYFMASDGAYLHRAIWESVNGPIPWGHHIHHLNKNRGDNRIENLSCMSKGDHMRLHGKEPKKRTPRTYGQAVCGQCGCDFTRKASNSLRCSKACTVKASNHQRHVRLACERAAGRVMRKCDTCGTSYLPAVNGTRYCGRPCAIKSYNMERVR